MEKVLKNYIILEGLLKGHSISRTKILRHFKGYAGINWKYVYENPSLFDAENLPPHKQLMSDVQNEIHRISDCGIHSVDNTSMFFPDELKQIKPEVHLLFTKGQQSILTLPKKVAIVGSRKPTAYGRKVAYDLGYYLGKRGVVVVSGMALGIDAQAHKGCIESGGNTIAVLASGVNKIYPSSNEKLYAGILSSGGLVISEQMIDEEPLRHHFPLRNRIISALADVVVIIEAGEKSGSLITAMHGIEQGKTVFALPGNIYSPQSEGSNKLLYEGAFPLIKFEHILMHLNLEEENITSLGANQAHLSPVANLIFNFLMQNKRAGLEEIGACVQIEYSEIYDAVSELILNDLCEFVTLNEVQLL